MQNQDIPDCIVKVLLKVIEAGHWTDAHYHLAGAGRAITFIRIAAHALEHLDNEQRIAEYHTYAGVSAARTAIDASASWLRLELGLKVGSLVQVDWKRQDYRKKAVEKKASVEPVVNCLGRLADEIDEHRQRAQHREGLALVFYGPGSTPGGWYLAPMGLSHSRADDVRLADLLGGWADRIQQNLCSMVEVIHGPIH